MDIKSFNDVKAALKPHVPPSRSMRKVYTLENMLKLMDFFGNPQESYKAIHIAGTSGKTSTAYYTAAMLTEAGKKVGLAVSPHVVEINDRTQINMVPLEEQHYCRYFSEFFGQYAKSTIEATYFELLVAFAYWVFAKEEVDYAVIEVGLGGLLDATNVIKRPDKVCVITDIGRDHTEVLGKTIPEIVAQKAGIIHPYNITVTYDQGDEVMAVVREICDQQKAELHEIWPLRPGELPKILPLFQRRNWYLALNVFGRVAERDGMPSLLSSQLAKVANTHIPARMEIVQRSGKTVVFDGAHNAQKMEALARSIKDRFGSAKIVAVLGLVRSKNFKLRTRLEAITGVADKIFITSFTGSQDMSQECVDPAKIAEYLHLKGFDGWEIIADAFDAYTAAQRSGADIILVTGSFYLIDEVRQKILKSS